MRCAGGWLKTTTPTAIHHSGSRVRIGVAMSFRVVALLLALCLSGAAEMRLSVEQLMSFLRSSIQLRQDDRQVADYVKKIKLPNRLEERTIEDLQGQGLGPKT